MQTDNRQSNHTQSITTIVCNNDDDDGTRINDVSLTPFCKRASSPVARVVNFGLVLSILKTKSTLISVLNRADRAQWHRFAANVELIMQRLIHKLLGFILLLKLFYNTTLYSEYLFETHLTI